MANSNTDAETHAPGAHNVQYIHFIVITQQAYNVTLFKVLQNFKMNKKWRLLTYLSCVHQLVLNFIPHLLTGEYA